jgi:hypothetical protein
MGRHHFDAKRTVEDSTELLIFKLREFGLLIVCFLQWAEGGIAAFLSGKASSSHQWSSV